MSRENVEIVRRIHDAAARGDSRTVLALYDPLVEVDSARSPGPRLTRGDTFRGHDGLRTFFRERAEAWEEIEDDLEEWIEAGDDVISVVTVRGRGRLSGVEVETPQAGIWTIRDGRVVRVVWHATRKEALEAVGLSE